MLLMSTGGGERWNIDKGTKGRFFSLEKNAENQGRGSEKYKIYYSSKLSDSLAEILLELDTITRSHG